MDLFFAIFSGGTQNLLQQTEYIEGYILEPMADRMLASDPKLAAEFLEKLATDEAFLGSPKDRLRWFYAENAVHRREMETLPGRKGGVGNRKETSNVQ